jgi:hypothetical protein
MYTLCPSTKYQILEPSVALSLSCHLWWETPFAMKKIENHPALDGIGKLRSKEF